MIKWSIFICCFLLVACHTNKETSITNTNINSNTELTPIDKEAKERFGDNYFVVNNATNQYSLVKSKTKKFSEIGFDITYFIFDNQSNEVITEDFLKSGHVAWIDDNTIKAVNRKIGKDKKRNKEVYQYNVKKKEKTVL